MIRLIALDLDGTLLGPDMRVAPADGAAVVAARDRGVHVVLNTSRWYSIAQRTAQRLELSAPIICHSGAHIREPNDGRELLHVRIPRDVAKSLAQYCDEAKLETYTTVDGITYMRTPRAAQIDPKRLPKDIRLAETHAEFVTADATGLVVFGDEAVPKLVDEFSPQHAGLAFPVGWSDGSPTYVTITAAGADKGRALRLVCEDLGVSPEDALAVGDAAPDLDMFDLAGAAVAMGNAAKEVKNRADAVAPSNSEGGVAWAIQKFVLDGT